MVVRLLKQNRKLNPFLSWKAESQEGCTVTVHNVSRCRSGAPQEAVSLLPTSPALGSEQAGFSVIGTFGTTCSGGGGWHHCPAAASLASSGLQGPHSPTLCRITGDCIFLPRQVVISLGPAVQASSTAHELCLPTTQRQPEETQHSTRVPTGSGSSRVMQMQPPLFLELGPNSCCQRGHSPVFLAPCPRAAVLSACPCSHRSFWDPAHALEDAHGSLIPTGALAKALTPARLLPADDWTPISAVLSTSTPSPDTGLRTWCVVRPGSTG